MYTTEVIQGECEQTIVLLMWTTHADVPIFILTVEGSLNSSTTQRPIQRESSFPLVG